MDAKILVTTSRRPTPTVRRFIKQLMIVIPNARYQSRGKLTLSMLVMQAVDFDIEKILIIRNRKGNPGYIDIYRVNHLDRTLTKLCALQICGLSMSRTSTKPTPKLKPRYIIASSDILSTIDNELIVDCLLEGFNVIISDTTPIVEVKTGPCVVLDARKVIKKIGNNELPMYEIMFRNTKNEIIGPVIKICRARTYTKAT